MFVLGIGGFYHDYNCCLLDTKKQKVSMCEAERISRRKHHVLRTAKEIEIPIIRCCQDLGIKPSKIDVVVIAHTDSFPCKEWIRQYFSKQKIVEVDHHMCHASGAFFASKFDEANIVSLDGFGDGSSALLAYGKGNKLEEVTRISDENSIGLEYLRATYHIGLGGYGSEGKTQGLAPYGEPTIYEDYMNEIEIQPDGNIVLSDRLKSEGDALAVEGGYLNSQMLNNEFLHDYCPRRIVPEPLTEVHNNLAASVQKLIEKVVLEITDILHKKTGSRNLVLSGGVSLNSSMNGVLIDSGNFDGIYALPMASDRGLGLGAVLYYVHQMEGMERFFDLDHVYYGQSYSDKDAKKAIEKAGLSLIKTEDVVQFTANQLLQNKIVGWFQGCSELGARALGNRSILASPVTPEMKDIINARVKHREAFRPFAPSVPVEHAGRYFKNIGKSADLGFMTFTVPANELGIEKAPATVHVDGTARIQTVEAHRNPLYHKLINTFGDLSGVPILLNTSFNDNKEPIVEAPEDAVKMFLNSDLDYLVIGNVVASKTGE